jgi:SAM-dependent methyltransferase
MELPGCPCCLSPIVAGALLVAIISFAILSQLSSSFFDQKQKQKSFLTKFLKFLFILTSFLILIFAIFLGVLSATPDLKSRFFAQLCAKMTQSPNLDPLRCGLVSKIHGRVLEFGFGPGTNFRCWNNSAITEWVGVDPNTHFQDLVEAEKVKYGLTFPTSIVWLQGEHVAVDPESFDFVIATHTLCSVSNVTQVLSQVARALKPGGRYHFFEHVTTPQKGGTIHMLQLLMAPFLSIVGNGCSFRELWTDLDSVLDPSSPFFGYKIDLTHILAPISLPPLEPHIIGTVTKPVRNGGE